MSRTAFDTSVLVAAVQSWHAEHERASQAVGRALRRTPVVVPVRVLLEAHSVLTRMPKPLRLSPQDAFSLLDRTLRGRSRVVDLDGETAFELLRAFRDRGFTGGAAHDAVIPEVAFRAGAQRLLSLDRRHFERLAPEGLQIAEP